MVKKFMSKENNPEDILNSIFPAKHTKSAIDHLNEARLRYSQGDWEKTILRTGKFVEAILKNVYIYCGKTLPPARRFQVGKICKELESLGPEQYNDNIRLLIPRACIFIYDIASNRGARHDSDEINPNETDSFVCIEIASWILGELVRFAAASTVTSKKTEQIVKQITKQEILTVGDVFEDADGCGYINSINIKKLSAEKTGLLILFANHPRVLPRNLLIEFIVNNGFSKKNAETAVTRLKKVSYIDKNDKLILRGIGRQKAKDLMVKIN